MSVTDRLSELGIELPTPPKPVAAYVPVVRTGNLLFVAGQLPMKEGKLLMAGPVSAATVAQAAEAAKQCAINLLAQVALEIGTLEKVRRVVRLGVFVACGADFYEQAKVANGASELMMAVFGDAGKHARAAVGTNVLPLNASVEVDAVIEVVDASKDASAFPRDI